MDIATLALIVSGVTIVLQIIILWFVIMLARRAPRTTEKTPALLPAAQNSEGPRYHQNRRDQENRFRDRPQEHRPASSPIAGPNQPNASVDKSLREINLRLKNAERSQENERKRISNNFSHDSRDTRDNRDSRDNRGGRQGSRPDWKRHNRPYNENRGQYGNERQESSDRRPAAPEPASPPAGLGPVQNTTTPVFEQNASVPSAAPVIAPQIVQPQSVSQPAPVESDSEVFHGRKLTVKRRMLGPEQAGSNESAGAEATSAPQSDSSDSSPDSGQVIFGRRRG